MSNSLKIGLTAGVTFTLILSLSALSTNHRHSSADGVVAETLSKLGITTSRASHPRDCEGAATLACIAVHPDSALIVHQTFLLFDFKQNLRHWPNVAGDISRSPPAL